MAYSKAFLFLAILFVIACPISSRVSARELVESVQTADGKRPIIVGSPPCFPKVDVCPPPPSIKEKESQKITSNGHRGYNIPKKEISKEEKKTADTEAGNN